MRLLVLAVLPDLRRDRHQRCAVRGCVGDTELHVDGTRPERRGYHGGPARDPSVHLGHERGALFVASQDVADPFRCRKRLDEPDVLLARDPEDEGDPFRFKALDHQLCCRAHRRTSGSSTRPTPWAYVTEAANPSAATPGCCA